MHDATPQAAVKNGVLILKKLYRNSVSNLDDFVKSLAELGQGGQTQDINYVSLAELAQAVVLINDFLGSHPLLSPTTI